MKPRVRDRLIRAIRLNVLPHPEAAVWVDPRCVDDEVLDTWLAYSAPGETMQEFRGRVNRPELMYR